MTIRAGRAWFLAICAVAGMGCTESSSTQVLTGRVTTSGALAVRAVTDDSTVTAAQVRSDGSFTLALPAGAHYRLEVLTTSGVRHVLSHKGAALSALSFDVCQPTDPFDCGGIGDGSTSGGGMGSGGGGGGMQPPCDASGNCPPPPCTDPSDPNCMPPPCTDPSGVCPPPTCDPADAMCPPPPPPPCTDPTDPQTCKDPCMVDPASCGCAMEDPNCWPPPEPPSCDAAGNCDPGMGGMAPDHPPGDFGCQGMPAQ